MFKAKRRTRVTLPRKTSARDVLVGVRHRRNYKTSCAEAVHSFKDGSKASGIVGGISETQCATEAAEALMSYSTDGCH